MKLHSLSKVLSFPLAIWFIIVLYLTFESRDDSLSYWLIPPVILLVVIYVMHPQIDFWWHKRQPPELDIPVRKWLENYSSYYNRLRPDQRKSFENRISLFVEAKEFIAQGSKAETMPEDLKAIIAHQAVQLSFGLKEFLFKKYTRFVIYKHPFPSPRQKYLHCVEVHHEDGAIIYSLEQLIPGILQPSKHFNLGLYSIADAWLTENPIEGLNIPDSFETSIPQIVNYDLEKILAITGKDFFSREAAFVTLLFTQPKKLYQFFPDPCDKISRALNQNPAVIS